MYERKQRWSYAIVTVMAITILHAQSSFAGFAGHNTKGDFGLQSGSQLPPGFYLVAPMYYRYDADTIRDRDKSSKCRSAGARFVDGKCVCFGFDLGVRL